MWSKARQTANLLRYQLKALALNIVLLALAICLALADWQGVMFWLGLLGLVVLLSLGLLFLARAYWHSQSSS